MKIRKTGLVLAITGCVALLIAGFLWYRHQQGPPSVIIVTIDTLRSDHCSAYGYSRLTTPALDQLAGEGAKFDIAYAVSSTTGPSHATLFTGTHPLSHGVTKNGHVLRNDIPVLADVFQSSGYQTAAFVSSFVLNSKFGFSRGFQTYDDRFKRTEASIDWRQWQGEKVEGGFDRRAQATTDRAIEWLGKRNASDPFFLWLHYFDPHHPYDPPQPYRTEFAGTREILPDDVEGQRDLYDAEIRYTSDQLARVISFLEQKGLSRKTLVVITSDHGEGFMEHGVTGHGKNLYEEVVRIPLVFRWPGRIPAGKSIKAHAGLIDIASTVTALAGLQMPDLQGINLVPFLTQENSPNADRKLFLHRRRYNDFAGDFFGLRWRNYKLLEAREEGIRELYDLDQDPGEKKNLAGTASSAPLEEFLADLQRWEKETTRDQNPQRELSTEDEERLKALGYVQ